MLLIEIKIKKDVVSKKSPFTKGNELFLATKIKLLFYQFINCNYLSFRVMNANKI
jgi:hypothetical protein